MTERVRLQAWCNGYEVVAAGSSEQAEQVLIEQLGCDPDEVEGDGWCTLAPSAALRDEDGTVTGETVGDALARPQRARVRHLWSVER